MYIYKLIDDQGIYIGSSKEYPTTSDSHLVRQLNKMNNPYIEVISSNLDEETSKMEVFNESLDVILNEKPYRLLNGRFHVEPIMKYLGRHFIVIVICEETKKVYLKSTYDPVEKLYRIFINQRGKSNIIDDLNTYGKDKFTVDVISTFDNPYKELLKLYKKYETEGYDFYNRSQYEEILYAESTVARLGSSIRTKDSN